MMPHRHLVPKQPYRSHLMQRLAIRLADKPISTIYVPVAVTLILVLQLVDVIK